MAKAKHAPDVVYVSFDEDGDPRIVSSDPLDCIDEKKTARYKFDGNVVVEAKVVVTDIK